MLFGERDITRLAAHARTRLGIARTFQQLAVFPSLTVAENVQVGAEQGRIADPAAVERALLAVRARRAGPRPAQGLPTGTLRRVELARALAGSPHVLLLDEPAAGLDTAEVTALARVLRALAADGTALLVVEHDLDLVADLADVVHVMAAGRTIILGPARHVLERGADEHLPAPRARALRPSGGPARRDPGRARPRRHRAARPQRLGPYDRPARPRGTVPLSDGAVVWDGVDVTRLPAFERARRGVCPSRSVGPSSARSRSASTWS